MGGETGTSSSEKLRRGDREEEDVKVIEWEEFDHELTRLWSLSSALKLATEKKLTLQPKLESLIQVFFSLSLTHVFSFGHVLILISFGVESIGFYYWHCLKECG